MTKRRDREGEREVKRKQREEREMGRDKEGGIGNEREIERGLFGCAG
jgi:hypothetical protein